MPDVDEIKQRIEAAIPGARAEVEDWTGGGDHFRATVTAPAFAGASRIEQHRLVYDVFGDEIGGRIHALSLKTHGPERPGAHETPIDRASESDATHSSRSASTQASR
jgi:stress-induced morphogen